MTSSSPVPESVSPPDVPSMVQPSSNRSVTSKVPEACDPSMFPVCAVTENTESPGGSVPTKCSSRSVKFDSHP
jgi:hypothetical protein